MAFRSHVVRGFDVSSLSNRLMFGLIAITGVAGVTVWISGGDIAVLWAPVQTFLVWALVRELDPDHDSTALLAGLVAGLWILAGFDVGGTLPAIGLLMAARVVMNTTGRRPLVWDLAALGVFAAVISFTAAGWVAGFGLAIAIYIDNRMAQKHTTAGALTAALAALGASAIASLSQVFPQQMPDISQLLVLMIGVFAIGFALLLGRLIFCRVQHPFTRSVSISQGNVGHERQHQEHGHTGCRDGEHVFPVGFPQQMHEEQDH